MLLLSSFFIVSCFQPWFMLTRHSLLGRSKFRIKYKLYLLPDSPKDVATFWKLVNKCERLFAESSSVLEFLDFNYNFLQTTDLVPGVVVSWCYSPVRYCDLLVSFLARSIHMVGWELFSLLPLLNIVFSSGIVVHLF